MSQLINNRFKQLIEEAESLKANAVQNRNDYVGTYKHIEEEDFIEWSVKAKHLLDFVCDKKSEHSAAFIEERKTVAMDDNHKIITRLLAVVKAAKDDFDGGFLTSFRNLIQAEVYSDELEQARELHKAGYIAPAAVVAGVVLETTLRNFCISKELPIGSMDRMNADLTKAGQYNTLTQKKITALAAIRNSAAHGKVDEYTTVDVKGMIDDIERLLESWLT